MAIKAVVFDIGGVLEITPKTAWEAKWEKQFGFEPGELDKRLMPVWIDGSAGKISEAQVETQIGEILGLEGAELDAFIRDIWDEYLGTPNTELTAYFAALCPRYRTGILSNSFAGARRREQERYGFGDMCDLIVYSHEEGIKKPNPHIYELVCTRLGVLPSETVFLDDIEASIIAAREVGMHGVHFQNNAQAIAEIEALLAQS